MEKEKLIELSKQYFDNNKDLNEIFASSDGNFFYAVSDLNYHVARTGLKGFTINRTEAYPKKVEKIEVKEVEKPVKKVHNNKK